MASKLTSGDISEITNQSDLISKFVRDNFTNLKNKTNEVIDDLAAVSIGTTNAETTAARPYHTSLKERLDDITTGKPNYRGSITSLVTESSPAAMTVDIAADVGQVGGITVNWSAATTGTITAPSVNPRIDVVVVNSDNTLSVVTGSEAVTPAIPTIASTQLPLARIDLATSTSTITNSLITNYNGYVWSQLGEIIAIHPDTQSAYLPNTFHYSLCDGTELLDSTYISTSNDTKVPDLSDDRFLRGGTSYGTGGTNTMDLEHNHAWLSASGVNFPASDSTFDSSGSIVTLTVATGSGSGVAIGLDAKNGGQLAAGVWSTTSYTDNELTTSEAMDPKYFNVLYYMRVR
jgi:hypothetical protein